MNDIYWKRRTMTVAFQRIFGILEWWNNNQFTPSLSKPQELSYRSDILLNLPIVTVVGVDCAKLYKVTCRANLYKVTRGAILYKVTFVQWSMFLSHHCLLILVNFDLNLWFCIPCLLSLAYLYSQSTTRWLINWLIFYNPTIFLFMIACVPLCMDC